jgi:hypothetical protein
MELIQLRPEVPTDTKWTINLKGRQLKLKLEPCRCGVEAKWVYEVDAREMLPPELRGMMDQMQMVGPKKVERTVAEWHFEPKWWEKHLLRHTLEGQLKKWIRKTYKDLDSLRESENIVDAVKQFVETI